MIRAISLDFKELNLGNVYLIRRKKQVILCMTVEYICGDRALTGVLELFEVRILDGLKNTLGITSVSSIRTKVRNVKATDDDGENEPQLAEAPVIPE